MKEIPLSDDRLGSIKNFLAITDDLGTAGQPTAEQFGDIAAAGYEVVINLDSATAVPNEDELVTSRGLSFIHIPVIWTAPQQSDLDLFFDMLDRLKGRKVFVHCAANARVSTFVYLYRVARLGVDPAAAKQQLDLLWEPTGVWKAFVEEAISRLGIQL
ncbi:MAG: protein tyrosine phosphatase family protein [Gemmatimonadota bacterium]